MSVTLFTSSTSCPRTEPLTDATAARLRAAHYVETYRECGWHCATGFDEQDRVVVMVHAGSATALERALHPERTARSAYA
jgi:hypothetical protein